MWDAYLCNHQRCMCWCHPNSCWHRSCGLAWVRSPINCQRIWLGRFTTSTRSWSAYILSKCIKQVGGYCCICQPKVGAERRAPQLLSCFGKLVLLSFAGLVSYALTVTNAPYKTPVYPRASSHCGNRMKSQVPDKTETYIIPPPNVCRHKQYNMVNSQKQMLHWTQTCATDMCFLDPRHSRRLQHQPQWDLKAKLCFFPGSQPKDCSSCWNTACARKSRSKII